MAFSGNVRPMQTSSVQHDADTLAILTHIHRKRKHAME